MKSLTESTFDTDVTAESNWLVVFWAAWCGPCIDVKYLEEFEAVTPGTLVGRVNVEENPDLAATYSIVAVPTYVLFKHGQPVKRLIGLQTKESLQEAVRSQ
jgi:thioredoxin 1